MSLPAFLAVALDEVHRSVYQAASKPRRMVIFRAPLDATTLRQVRQFIASWSADDVYSRFGTLGPSGPEWLFQQLSSDVNRGAFFACDARRRLLGLLDFVDFQGELHVGIVVDAAFRRSRIRTRLLSKLLRDRPVAHPLAAQCDAGNAAAVALLRSCGFTRIGSYSTEMIWCHE